MLALSKRSKAARANRRPGCTTSVALPKETSGSEWELDENEDHGSSVSSESQDEEREGMVEARAGHSIAQHRFAAFFGKKLDAKDVKTVKEDTKSQTEKKADRFPIYRGDSRTKKYRTKKDAIARAKGCGSLQSFEFTRVPAKRPAIEVETSSNKPDNKKTSNEVQQVQPSQIIVEIQFEEEKPDIGVLPSDNNPAKKRRVLTSQG